MYVNRKCCKLPDWQTHCADIVLSRISVNGRTGSSAQYKIFSSVDRPPIANYSSPYHYNNATYQDSNTVTVVLVNFRNVLQRANYPGSPQNTGPLPVVLSRSKNFSCSTQITKKRNTFKIVASHWLATTPGFWIGRRWLAFLWQR